MTKKMLLLATLVLLVGMVVLYAQTRPGPFVGVITDTMCGVDHAMMGDPDIDPAQCTIDCVKSNPKKYRYALAVGNDIYILSDQRTPEQFAGRKVRVTGTLYEKTKVIDVKKIEAAK
jgi:hypothetical protein